MSAHTYAQCAITVLLCASNDRFDYSHFLCVRDSTICTSDGLLCVFVSFYVAFTSFIVANEYNEKKKTLEIERMKEEEGELSQRRKKAHRSINVRLVEIDFFF